MPTLEWLKREFSYGYDSGNILTLIPRRRRRDEQHRCGASYRRLFFQAIRPNLSNTTTVLELGPGAGSWTRAILRYIPEGHLYAVDFQDVSKWLKPEKYGGRLIVVQVNEITFQCIPNGVVDFFWSFGVLCHNNTIHIQEILHNALPKMRPGGIAIHQYADWDKLEKYGWNKGGVPVEFRTKNDDRIWWPRNSQATMTQIAIKAGWQVLSPDMHLIKRDGLIKLRRPDVAVE